MTIKGRICNHTYDERHSLQLLDKANHWACENGTRLYWETEEEVEQYAKDHGIEIVGRFMWA